jgi:hypothetical protein
VEYIFGALFTAGQKLTTASAALAARLIPKQRKKARSFFFCLLNYQPNLGSLLYRLDACRQKGCRKGREKPSKAFAARPRFRIFALFALDGRGDRRIAISREPPPA